MPLRYFSMSFHGPTSSSVSPILSRSAARLSACGPSPPVETDCRQTELGAQPSFDHGFADELGCCGDDRFGHADLLRPVGEIRAAQWQRLQCHRGLECLELADRARQINQQNVSGQQFRPGRGRQNFRPEPLAALDRENVGAGGAAKVQFLQLLAGQRRPAGNPHAPFAVGQVILLYPGGEAHAIRGLALAVGRQPSPREDHVDDPENENRDAKRREGEEAESPSVRSARVRCSRRGSAR